MNKEPNKRDIIAMGSCSFSVNRPTDELRVVKKSIEGAGLLSLFSVEVVVAVQRKWIVSNGPGTTLEKWEDLPSAE